jgi:hypothetical protein
MSGLAESGVMKLNTMELKENNMHGKDGRFLMLPDVVLLTFLASAHLGRGHRGGGTDMTNFVTPNNKMTMRIMIAKGNIPLEVRSKQLGGKGEGSCIFKHSQSFNTGRGEDLNLRAEKSAHISDQGLNLRSL